MAYLEGLGSTELLNDINGLVLVIETRRVFYEVLADFLYVIFKFI